MRRASGRKGDHERKILTYLDRFLAEDLKPGQPITIELVERWFKNMEYLSVGTRINRISLLRQFCFYLGHFDPRTCIIHRSFLPRRTRPAPYIYSQQEVCSIMASARQIGPVGSLRPAVVSTLIGLLYTTGLRIGEALKLTLEDIDLRVKLITVRETKFRKSRYVPLSLPTVHHLARFLRYRKKAGFSTVPTAPVFVNPQGRTYGHPRIVTIFLEIIRNLGIRSREGERGPRLHDFRHTFAVNRLALWYREGVNPSVKLPLLSTYLGHTTVTCTEVYLQATAELLEKTGKRFHDYFAIPSLKNRKGVPHAKKH